MFKAAQQHKTWKQETLTAAPFSQSPWSPNPSQARGSHTGEPTLAHTDRHTTPQPHPNSHTNTSPETLLLLPSGNAVPAKLNLGTHLHKRLGSTNFDTGIMSPHLTFVGKTKENIQIKEEDLKPLPPYHDHPTSCLLTAEHQQSWEK